MHSETCLKPVQANYIASTLNWLELASDGTTLGGGLYFSRGFPKAQHRGAVPPCGDHCRFSLTTKIKKIEHICLYVSKNPVAMPQLTCTNFMLCKWNNGWCVHLLVQGA